MEATRTDRLPRGERGTLDNCILVVLIYLLALQSPLEKVSGVFKYIDELAAVGGIGCWLVSSIKYGRFRLKHYVLATVLGLLLFLASGLAGNVLYGYQPWNAVLTDLFTNLKFFMALMLGYALMPKCQDRMSIHYIGTHLRLIMVLVFAAFCVERVTPVFGMTQVRYGLRTAQMFYTHSTYLAGSMAFLVAAMTVFYEKKNLPYIGIGLLIMMFTLRSKAIVSAMVYVMLYMFLVVIKGKLKLWHIGILGVAALVVGWEQISFYFIELGGGSARSVMTATSFQIMGDYFPIGTGFGTYGSSAAADNYSPVYVLYGFDEIYELASWNPDAFLGDTFWPIIVGQTGFIGTVGYVSAMGILFHKVFWLRKVSKYQFVAGLFAILYLLISSTAEPAFNNSVAIPLAVLLGGLIRVAQRDRYPDGCPSTRLVL